jgi:hypothetical protein
MQFVAIAIKDAEVAKKTLAEKRGQLSVGEVRYLESVVRQGEYAQGIMNEHLRDREAARKRGEIVDGG